MTVKIRCKLIQTVIFYLFFLSAYYDGGSRNKKTAENTDCRFEVNRYLKSIEENFPAVWLSFSGILLRIAVQGITT